MATPYIPSFNDVFDDLLGSINCEAEADADPDLPMPTIDSTELTPTSGEVESPAESPTKKNCKVKDKNVTRAKKKAVPEEAKDEKYWSMRRKNNEATKRCREAKRQEISTTLSSASNLDKDFADAKDELEIWTKKYKSMKESNKELEIALAKITGNLNEQ